ncbi:MAG: VWA domain-containing protein [Thermoanaerobaculum sp.]|nr:VWA domain-containing protein [Thermoanaerobaculum sp.]MDW7967757.1 VWA domain-containing protein [Thermoanaerobaculum sp.]
MIAFFLLLAAASPLALRLETEPLGRGRVGTVVAVAVQVAPEDRAGLGGRVRFSLQLLRGGQRADAGEGVVELAGDGSFLLYREWPPGEGTLQLEVSSLDGSRRGRVVQRITVPVLQTPFLAPEQGPADAAALMPLPPEEEAVRFLAPRSGAAVGTLFLTVKVPSATAEVRFFQDGELILTKNRAPWELALTVGAVPRRSVVRAEAWGAGGRFLGEDALVLHGSPNQLEVQLLLREPQGRGGPVQVTVATSPPGLEEEVVLRLDERAVARWLACPCVVQLKPQELAQARVMVAEARGGGRSGEAVLVVGSGTIAESARVDVVELPVAVLDERGKPVTDLSPADFRVLDDGQEVRIDSVSLGQDLALSLGLAVDVSGSMSKDFPLVRRAASGFLSTFLRPQDRFFLATFSWEFSLLVPWTADARLAASRLEHLNPEGGTSLHDAVIKGLELFRGRQGPRGLVIITDGEDTTSRTGWDVALRYARTARTPVFPVGIRLSLLDFLLRGKLTELAGATSGEAFFVSDPGDLPEVYRRIGEQLRSQYLVVYRAPGTASADHFRPVVVKVLREGVSARTIPGYFPVP